MIFFRKGFSRKNLCLMFDLLLHYFLTAVIDVHLHCVRSVPMYDVYMVL
jgi:hypothetical protein